MNEYASKRCPTLCEYIKYEIGASPSGANYMEFENKTTLWVVARESKPRIKIEQEYFLMGGNAMISATGGSLGLFLGLSCYGAAWTILEKVEIIINYVVLSWRRKKSSIEVSQQTSDKHGAPRSALEESPV